MQLQLGTLSFKRISYTQTCNTHSNFKHKIFKRFQPAAKTSRSTKQADIHISIRMCAALIQFENKPNKSSGRRIKASTLICNEND